MAKLIGTAGHVDHGKTTLIKALTGIDADRLPEEKARGMTIDIGFAFLDVPGIGRVSIVDVPGHERLVTNMLVGAQGVDLALLCIAADEGIKPQTREHLEILELLPVDRLIVAFTRSDLADSETFELVRLEASELLEKNRFADAPMFAVDSISGQGISELKGGIAEALGNAKKQKFGSWYLPIDRVFSVKGHGCVVTGTLTRGQVEVGGIGIIQPGNWQVRIRSIHSHNEEIQIGEPGSRIALNLAGVKVEDLQRGKAIGAPGALFATKALDVRVKWIRPCRHAEQVRVSIGTSDALAKAFLNEHRPELVQLRFDEEVAAALGQPVIIRRHSPPDLLGGGTVEVPVARARRKSEKAESFSGKDIGESIFLIAQAHVGGVETTEICRQLGMTPQELGNHFEKLIERRALVSFAGLWMTAENWKETQSRLISALESLNRKSPTTPWQPREAVIKEAGLTLTGKSLDRAIALLAENGLVETQGTGIKLPQFQVQLTERQRAFLDRVKAELETESVSTPNPHDLSKRLHVPMPAVEEILKLGNLAGEIVLLEDNIAYTASQIEALRSELAKFADGKPFTAGAARDHLKASRKYIIPLLEHMDKTQFTMRIGDQRVVRKP